MPRGAPECSLPRPATVVGSLDPQSGKGRWVPAGGFPAEWRAPIGGEPAVHDKVVNFWVLRTHHQLPGSWDSFSVFESQDM